MGGIAVKFGVVYNISLFHCLLSNNVMSNKFFCLVILFDEKCLSDVCPFFNSPIYIVKSRLV